jgi:hypothetical protein
MPLRISAKNATSREKIFWAFIGMLAVGQLIAIWMLCSHQVSLAQARQATAQVERMALADCLRAAPGLASRECEARLAAPRHDPRAVLAASENTAHFSAAAGRAAHVNFSLR